MNPILQAMNGMNQANQMMKIINQIKNGNVNEIYNRMINTNPNFKSFVDNNKDKSIEQIAKENNIDYNMLKQLIR